MSKPLMLVPVGLPGSGKTVFSKAWLAEDPDARVRINYDDMRIARYGDDYHFSRKAEDDIKKAAIVTITAAVEKGLSVVIDNTNLSPGARIRWELLATSLGADYEEKFFDTDLFECIQRDKKREGRARVGRAVIEWMALKYGLIDWEGCDGNILIVDIDGTLADCSHRLRYIKVVCLKCGRAKEKDSRICQRPVQDGKPVMCGGEFSKKDWGAFFRDLHLDKPIQPVVDLVNRMHGDHVICLVTGRDTSIGVQTEEWLDKHGVKYDFLFMRGSGDHRPDYEHKLEVLERMPRDKVVMAFEDRDQCVKMYREQGIRCLQVGDGDF